MPRETMQQWDAAREARLADPDNPALIDAEYEAEREHFRRVRQSQSRRRQILTILIIFALAAAAWQIRETVVETQDNTAQVHALTVRNRALVTSLQSAIVEACEEIGNSRAEAQREQLHEEITKAEHPDPGLIRALNIPPETIERLTAEQVAALNERLGKVRLSDCAQQYKISPGRVGRRREP